MEGCVHSKTMTRDQQKGTGHSRGQFCEWVAMEAPSRQPPKAWAAHLHLVIVAARHTSKPIQPVGAVVLLGLRWPFPTHPLSR